MIRDFYAFFTLVGFLVCCGSDDSVTLSTNDKPIGGDQGELTDMSSVDQKILTDSGFEACEGENKIELAYVRRLTTGALAPGSEVVWENGHTFLYIAGDCTYWTTGNNLSESRGQREGKLTTGQLKDLQRELRFNEWAMWFGSIQGPWHDANRDQLYRSDGIVECDANCAWDGAPAGLNAIYESAMSWMEDLYQQGQPLEGAVRVAAFDIQDNFPKSSQDTPAWPLDRSISDYVIPREELGYGKGILVEGEDASSLRTLRAASHGGEYKPLTTNFVPVRDAQGRLMAVYIRDTLPIENSKGLVQLGEE